MKLTTKGRYAVTAMLDLAIHDGDGPVALADIPKRQGISLSYLEQLFARLRKSGLRRQKRCSQDCPAVWPQLHRNQSRAGVS